MVNAPNSHSGVDVATTPAADHHARGAATACTVAAPISTPTTAVYPARISPANKPAGRFNLLTADMLAALPPMRWRIHGVLPAAGLGLLVGASTAGKTFLALDIAAHIALGLDWFEFVTKPAPVVYVGLEAQLGIRTRIEAWQQHHGRSLPASMRFILQPFNMLQPELVDEMAADVVAAGGIGGVIIVDTLSQATPGADENSGVDMGDIIQSATRLQHLTNSLVLLVHHKGKNQSAGARGHTKLIAAADAAIAVNHHHGRRLWTTDPAEGGKAKEAEAVSRRFELLGVDLGQGADGERLSSAVVVPNVADTQQPRSLSDSQAAALEAFHVAARVHGKLDATGNFAGLSIDAWREQAYRTSAAKSPDSKKKSFQRARAALIASGRILVTDESCCRLGGTDAALEAEIAEALRGKGRLSAPNLQSGQGTPGTMAGQCPPVTTQDGDNRDTAL